MTGTDNHGSYGSSRRNVLVEVDQRYRWTLDPSDPRGEMCWFTVDRCR